MTIDDAKMMSAVLRRLADALDRGEAQVSEMSVHNDTDLVEIPSEPHEHQQRDVVFREQRIRVTARCKRVLYGGD